MTYVDDGEPISPNGAENRHAATGRELCPNEQSKAMEVNEYEAKGIVWWKPKAITEMEELEKKTKP